MHSLYIVDCKSARLILVPNSIGIAAIHWVAACHPATAIHRPPNIHLDASVIAV